MTLRWIGVAALFAAAAGAFAQSGEGKLKVDAKPSRAGVFLDGKYLGPAGNFARARTYSVPPGQHELILREPRYQDYSTTVTVEPGKTLKIKPAMNPKPLAQPPFGTLKLSGFDKYSPVFVNDSFMGHADEFDFGRQGLLLNPGTYDVKVTTVDGMTLTEQKVTIREKVTETLRRN